MPTPTENHEKILRDYLALDRTAMANQRTLLSYIRTVIMLFASGITLSKISSPKETLFYLGLLIILGAGIFLIIGIYNYKKVTEQINNAYFKRVPENKNQ